MMSFWRKTSLLAALLVSSSGVFAQTPVQPASFTNTKPAAIVNGEIIPMVEVEKILSMRPIVQTITAEQKREMERSAVEMLVNDALLRQYLTQQVVAQRIPKVNQADLTRELTELQQTLQKQNKSIEGMLKETNTTMELLYKDITARLQWKNFLTMMLPEDKAQKYYADNKMFFDKVFVKASHILVKVDPKADAAVKNQKKQMLEAIRNEIVGKKVDFATAAQKWSECPSREKGGDIGPFPYKFVVVPPFAQAAFTTNVGDITGVIETEFGYHIILVTERSKGEPTTYELVRDAVREVWANENDLQQRILTDYRKVSKIELK